LIPGFLQIRRGATFYESIPGCQLSEGRRAGVAALRKAGWNKAKAARILGIGRRTIYRKMATYRITGES